MPTGVICARTAATASATAAATLPGVAAVALVRPGYPDGAGESSGVAALHAGRNDHYTKENVEEVGAALARLRERAGAKRLVVVGHSGGAATTAILLGMKPGLIDAAVPARPRRSTMARIAGSTERRSASLTSS